MLKSDQLEELRPEISMDGHSIVLNGRVLTIVGKPYLLRVLRIFLTSEKHVVSKKDLVKDIYFPHAEVSPRYENHARTNLVKLLSRARQLLSDSFPEWDWLPYDDQNEAWHLYRLPFFRV